MILWSNFGGMFLYYGGQFILIGRKEKRKSRKGGSKEGSMFLALRMYMKQAKCLILDTTLYLLGIIEAEALD